MDKQSVTCPFCNHEFVACEWECGECPECGEEYSWDSSGDPWTDEYVIYPHWESYGAFQ